MVACRDDHSGGTPTSPSSDTTFTTVSMRSGAEYKLRYLPSFCGATTLTISRQPDCATQQVALDQINLLRIDGFLPNRCAGGQGWQILVQPQGPMVSGWLAGGAASCTSLTGSDFNTGARLTLPLEDVARILWQR